MVTGIALFKCDECGKHFVSVAAEWQASALIAPMPCPKCGSQHTYPIGLRNLGGLTGPGIYKKIWESNEQ